MIGRPRLTWLVFALCALLVVDVLGWATWSVLRLEAREREASAQADAAQRERLALWQMDSLVSALIARESARPYFVYRPRYAADLPYDRAWDLDDAGAVSPSPLADGPGDPIIRLHYQVEPGGRVVSPQGGAREYAPVPEDEAPDPGTLRARRLIRELASNAAFPEEPGAARLRSETAERFRNLASEPPTEADAAGPEPRKDQLGDADLRRQLFDLAREGRAGRAAPPTARVDVGVFQPRWLLDADREPQLVFERPVGVGDETFTQGLWVDWPALRGELLGVAARLLPRAKLEPVPGRGEPGDRTLATIPLRLVSPTPEPAVAAWTPTRVTLVVTWLATLIALLAIGLVLRAAIRLADRRGRFVTAVTHELRSPLTSFRLYTDLLRAGGDNPDRRAQYVEALQRESRRLGTVVENVLAYAGLRRRPGDGEPAAMGTLLDRLIPSLRERTERSGAALEVRIDDRAREAHVRVAPGSVERILVNLVDNACRYGGGGDEPVVRLVCERAGAAVRVRVSDTGPGVPAGERERIFSDFYRGRTSRGEHRGMGLGLALARGLARAEGGEVRLVRPDDPGATFELMLPVARIGST